MSEQRKLWTWSIDGGTLVNDPNGDIVLLSDAVAAVQAEREAADRRLDELDESYAGQTNDWANGWHEAIRAAKGRHHD